LYRLREMKERMEVIVVDGGSEDYTTGLAQRMGVRVVSARRGRGPQLHAGALSANGDVLWFLHADTLPPRDAAERIHDALRDPRIVGGHFTIHFEGHLRASRFLTWLYPHLSWLGLCYGDSALFVRRQAYEQIGGFKPFPIFEDLDLQRRLMRHGQFIRLPSVVSTSSRRFERRFASTFAFWTSLQVLYWIGVSPSLLGRVYAPIRGRREVNVPRSFPIQQHVDN
jgi:rSAM/selenodomain-associated transferase 2